MAPRSFPPLGKSAALHFLYQGTRSERSGLRVYLTRPEIFDTCNHAVPHYGGRKNYIERRSYISLDSDVAETTTAATFRCTELRRYATIR